MSESENVYSWALCPVTGHGSRARCEKKSSAKVVCVQEWALYSEAQHVNLRQRTGHCCLCSYLYQWNGPTRVSVRETRLADTNGISPNRAKHNDNIRGYTWPVRWTSGRDCGNQRHPSGWLKTWPSEATWRFSMAVWAEIEGGSTRMCEPSAERRSPAERCCSGKRCVSFGGKKQECL